MRSSRVSERERKRERGTHDAVDLVGDAVRELAEDGRREVEPLGRHKVLGLDGANADDLLVRPAVALDADGLDGQQRAEGLAHLVVDAGLADLLDEDGVGVLRDADLVGRNLAEDADGEARAGERVAHDEVSRDIEKAAERTDLVCRGKSESMTQRTPRRTTRKREKGGTHP